MSGVQGVLLAFALFNAPSMTMAQSPCEIAEILFGPTSLDILRYEGGSTGPGYETAIVRSDTFDNPEKPFGAILGEITVDRGGFAVRNTNQVVVGVISPQLILEGWSESCDESRRIEIVPVKVRSYVILSQGSPVGTISGRFPENSFGVSTE